MEHSRKEQDKLQYQQEEREQIRLRYQDTIRTPLTSSINKVKEIEGVDPLSTLLRPNALSRANNKISSSIASRMAGINIPMPVPPNPGLGPNKTPSDSGPYNGYPHISDAARSSNNSSGNDDLEKKILGRATLNSTVNGRIRRAPTKKGFASDFKDTATETSVNANITINSAGPHVTPVPSAHEPDNAASPSIAAMNTTSSIIPSNDRPITNTPAAVSTSTLVTSAKLASPIVTTSASTSPIPVFGVPVSMSQNPLTSSGSPTVKKDLFNDDLEFHSDDHNNIENQNIIDTEKEQKRLLNGDLFGDIDKDARKKDGLGVLGDSKGHKGPAKKGLFED